MWYWWCHWQDSQVKMTGKQKLEIRFILTRTEITRNWYRSFIITSAFHDFCKLWTIYQWDQHLSFSFASIQSNICTYTCTNMHWHNHDLELEHLYTWTDSHALFAHAVTQTCRRTCTRPLLTHPRVYLWKMKNYRWSFEKQALCQPTNSPSRWVREISSSGSPEFTAKW